MARTLDYAEAVGYCTSNLARLMLMKKDWQQAENFAREVLSLAEEVGRLEMIGTNNHHLAQALLGQGKNREALPYAQLALNICQQLGRAQDVALARKTLAACEAKNS